MISSRLATVMRCSIRKQITRKLRAIINLNRIAFYVTNKKGGDNVKAALQDVVRRDHRLAGFDIPGVKTELITGAIDAGLIGAIVTEAASIPSAGSIIFTDMNVPIAFFTGDARV